MRGQDALIHILMAEDDPDDRMLVAEAFEEKRVANTLNFVEDGEALLDYLNRRGMYQDDAGFPWPDIILLDLNMPRMDGREALKIIKADPRFRSIPVIVLTGYPSVRNGFQAITAGACEYLVKPFKIEDLLGAITLALRNYRYEPGSEPGNRPA